MGEDELHALRVAANEARSAILHDPLVLELTEALELAELRLREAVAGHPCTVELERLEALLEAARSA